MTPIIIRRIPRERLEALSSTRVGNGIKRKVKVVQWPIKITALEKGSSNFPRESPTIFARGHLLSDPIKAWT